MNRFESTWASMVKAAPLNTFNLTDKNMCKLFYDIGAADVVQSVRDAVQPFVALSKTVE